MKKKNNRNKLPLVLAALLTLSLVVYGSFAYFSSSQTVTPDLELDLGHIVVTAEPENWKYVTEPENSNRWLKNDNKALLTLDNEGNILTDKEMTTVNNVRPGDKFTRDITFTLDTTLDTMVTINNEVENLTEGPYRVSIEYKDSTMERKLWSVKRDPKDFYYEEDEKKLLLTPMEGSVTVTVAVEVIADDSYNTNDSQKEKSLNKVIEGWAEKAITVTAQQASVKN